MSDRLELLFRAPRVITAAGEVARCIGVRDGRIAVIEPIGAELDADEVVELGDDEVLIPGLVDTHVHVNEPGRTAWEGFASATRAAAAGGVTTIVDMPLNSIPPTVDVEALAVKRRVAADQAYVDVGFWGVRCRAMFQTCVGSTTRECSASSASCCTPAWTSFHRSIRRDSNWP
jgi:Dihydroorotase and related cyclic amidohydrolases